MRTTQKLSLVAWLGLRWLIVFIAGTSSAQAAEKPAAARIRVAVIGDSTVCKYRPDSPIRGWGEYLGSLLSAKASISNFAVSGASTRSFIGSARWEKTLESRPHYVLIQFGHNDSHTADSAVGTDPHLEYPAFLRRFVSEARAVGAKPILITPMERRIFDGAGAIRENLSAYSEAMKKLAREEKVPVIDLHEASCGLYKQLGRIGTAQLGASADDRTHFNEKGAKAMARLIAVELVAQVPALSPTRKVSKR